MQAKRSAWIENISDANAEHQIYLDESGIKYKPQQDTMHVQYMGNVPLMLPQ